jgi:hypothetical protein
MLNTYIKNRGTTKTILHKNNHSYTNELNWDAEYDGDIANISIDAEVDGKPKHFDIKLDNNDLANLLNVESIDMPIHKRLQMDFEEPTYMNKPYYIELPQYEEEFVDRHISSPKTNEIFLPLTLDVRPAKKYTLTSKKNHKRRKTHVTHRLYKKTKSKSSKRTKSSKSKTKTSRKSSPILELL